MCYKHINMQLLSCFQDTSQWDTRMVNTWPSSRQPMRVRAFATMTDHITQAHLPLVSQCGACGYAIHCGEIAIVSEYLHRSKLKIDVFVSLHMATHDTHRDYYNSARQR